MELSVRECDVLDAIARCSVIGMRALAHDFETRMSADELEVVIQSLRLKGAVNVEPGSRGDNVRMTAAGRRARQVA